MPKSKNRKKKPSARTPTLNAISVQRERPSRVMAIGDAKKPSWMVENDPLFHDLYQKYLKGQIPAHVTRVPSQSIQAGFYVPARGFEYGCDSPPDKVITALMRDIQNGSRHPVHLYANPAPDKVKPFLCPDDVAIFSAYVRLNILSVPAIVLSTGNSVLPLSSLKAKASPAAVDMGPRIVGIQSAPLPELIASILGKEIPTDPIAAVSTLNATLQKLIAKLRLFHFPSSNQLHYHHMVFSALVRAQETLQAITLLIANDLWYQALALLRVLYEIHLNFYFDWLQPQTNYRFLAAAAALSTSEISKKKNEMRKDLAATGMPATDAEMRSSLAWHPVNMAATVSEKAKLPLVGIAYHKDIYSLLSQITHQDFEVASLHANRFDDETFRAIDGKLKTSYLRFMDMIVAEFAECIDHDLGNSTPQ